MSLDDQYLAFQDAMLNPPPAPPINVDAVEQQVGGDLSTDGAAPAPAPAPAPVTVDPVENMVANPSSAYPDGLPSLTNRTPSKREDVRFNTIEYLMENHGLDLYKARRMSEQLWGNPDEFNSTALGLGIADFLGGAYVFGVDEGVRQVNQGLETGSAADVAIGSAVAGLSSLEGIPLAGAGVKVARKAMTSDAVQDFFSNAVTRFNNNQSPIPVGMSIEDAGKGALVPAQVSTGPAPVFFSSVSNAVDSLPMEKGSADQMRAMIAKGEGVKAEEMAWIGLDDFLARKKTATKQEIQNYVAANKVELEEVVKKSDGNDEDVYENLNWEDPIVDDAYDAYSYRSEDIAYEIDSGDEFFIEDVIANMQKSDPKKYSEVKTDWANSLRDHFENGGTIDDLDSTTRFDIQNAIDDVAKSEYLDNPYVSVRNADGYEIYGNDDVGYQIMYNGNKVNRQEIYSLSEAKIESHTHAMDEGNVEFNRGGDQAEFSAWVEDGGENYREVLLIMPEKRMVQGRPVYEHNEKFYVQKLDRQMPEHDRSYKTVEAANDAALATVGQGKRTVPVPGEAFTSGHFSEDNVLSHLRLNDRTGPNEERVLFIEEIQSDWHQKGRTLGYKGDQNTDALLVEFNKARDDYMNAMKRDPQATLPKGRDDLDGLAAHTDEQSAAYKRMVKAQEAHNNAKSVDQSALPDAPLKKTWHEMSFRRVARLAAEEGYDSISWTSGKMQVDRYPGMPDGKKEGLKNRYDIMLTSYAKKWGKKFDSTVGVGDVNGNEVWSMPVTQKMKDSVLSKGVPLFGAAGIAAGMNNNGMNTQEMPNGS